MAQGADPISIPEIVSATARDIGATDVVLYLVDFEQGFLEPLPDPSVHAELSHTEEVATTIAGRSFLDQMTLQAERPDGIRLWAPVVEGSDRTGVLALTVPKADDVTVQACTELGLLAGALIATHARCTDTYNLHRRRKPMSLAASMQWDLLPPLVLKAGRAGIAALLEPAYEVGGDCFDYAVNGPILDLIMVDAMGHGVGSAMIAALTIGCYRHHRREGRPLTNIHSGIDSVLASHLQGDGYATGQLARLELDTGAMTWTNAGHPLPLLIRGHKVIGELNCPPSLPWGLGGQEINVATEALEPGDRVFFYTDGVTEARTPEGETFGTDRLVDLITQNASEQHEPEHIVRGVVKAVLEHQRANLSDDATVMLMGWSGPSIA